MSDSPQNLIVINPAVDHAIAAWLDAKTRQSEKTKTAYIDMITQFRAVLQRFGLDLDGGPQHDMDAVSLTAQGWSSRRAETSMREGDVAATTVNQRLAIISSFYEYARKKRLLRVENPIESIDRRKVQDYAHATPLDKEEVERRLEQIDRETPAGKRDHALLSIAFSTGRRASELAGLRWGDIHQSGNKVTVTWRQGKGGKVHKNELGANASKLLMEYLHAVYGAELGSLPNDAPVWVAFTHNFYRGGAISTRAISNLYKKHLEISKVHASRHTFAHGMMELGVQINDLADLLGHDNTATTSRYVKVLRSGNNPLIEKLERRFGIVAEEEDHR